MFGECYIYFLFIIYGFDSKSEGGNQEEMRQYFETVVQTTKLEKKYR